MEGNRGLALARNRRKIVPRIKICGRTCREESSDLNEMGASYAGFVLWEKSRRGVSVAQAEEIGKCLKEGIKRVAVTVSPDLALLEQIEEAGFDILQVHGELSGEVLARCRIPVWRACNLKQPQDLKRLEYHPGISGYVVDAGEAGSGQKFDWQGSKKAVEEMRNTVCAGKDFILAGGLNPENAAQAVRIFQPDVVDVSSGVEGADGKERILIEAFTENVRQNVDRINCRKGER